jgi:hypothetical protein
VKMLFVIGTTSRVRHYRDVIHLLVERGHELHLAARSRGGDLKWAADLEQHPRIECVESPNERSDAWKGVVEPLRLARDYVRYLDPRYARAVRLVHRAEEIAPPELVQLLERYPLFRRNWKRLGDLLAVAETLVPPDPEVERFLKRESPDLMLITPLVTFDGYQTDYVKAARKLGIRSVFLPFSWDNLTNKGLMRVQPDLTLVWNNAQRQEAIELHGADPRRVIVTGAPRFDEFFALRASSSRETFCQQAGLDPTRRFILYLGSSPLTGQNEVDFVRRWVRELRRSDDPVLQTCGVLIRPHPVCKAEWRAVDMSDLADVSIRVPGNRTNADQELYDALLHAATVVGMNTSAMIEAGILGKSVHTIIVPGYDEGQLGTLHFDLLLSANGGLVNVARSFEEHRRQLSTALQTGTAVSARSLKFIEGFVRPHGLDVPASETTVREIERAVSLPLRPHRQVPLWHGPARALLLGAVRRQFGVSRSAELGKPAPAAGALALRAVHSSLQELAGSQAPIVVGPWFDDPVHELVHWIPFLRWAVANYRIPVDRLVVISRGGVRDWYGGLADQYVDIDELFPPDVVQQQLAATVVHSKRHPKFLSLSSFETEIVDATVKKLSLGAHQILHPSTMFRILTQARDSDPVGGMQAYGVFETIKPSDGDVPHPMLPSKYVAVDFSPTEAFPDNPENQVFAAAMLKEIAEKHTVVLLSREAWPANLADSGPCSDRVHLFDHGMSPMPRLGVQTRVLAGAESFVGSYGGLAHLAALVGTLSVSFYSRAVPRDQLSIARDRYPKGAGAFLTFAVSDFRKLELLLGRGSRSGTQPRFAGILRRSHR